MRTTTARVVLAAVLIAAGCGSGGSAPAIAAPSNLQVAGFTTTSVSIGWTDNSSNEDGFRVYRSTNGVDFAVVGTAVLPSYPDLTVTQGTRYYYYVTAYNATDESWASNTVSVTPDTYHVTLLYPNGSEMLMLGEMVNITWDTNMPGFDARVLLSTDGGGTFPTNQVIQFAWAPNAPPIPWKVGYRNTTTDPLAPPNWEQAVFSTNSQCVIRIRDYNDAAVTDESDGTFTIVAQ